MEGLCLFPSRYTANPRRPLLRVMPLNLSRRHTKSDTPLPIVSHDQFVLKLIGLFSTSPFFYQSSLTEDLDVCMLMQIKG